MPNDTARPAEAQDGPPLPVTQAVPSGDPDPGRRRPGSDLRNHLDGDLHLHLGVEVQGHRVLPRLAQGPLG